MRWKRLRRKYEMRKWIAGFPALLLTVGVLFSCPSAVFADEIPKGIWVGGQDVGGMTKEEAQNTVQNYVDSLSGQKITLAIAGEKIETTAEELGFFWSNTDAVEQAAQYESEGNLIQRYMAKKDLEVNPVEIPLQTQVDEAKVNSFVTDQCAPYVQKAQDATIHRENGTFVITESKVGRVVDIAATTAALNEAMANGLEEAILVEAVVTEEQPKVTYEQLATIQDVLGTFTTSFKSSGAARVTNLQVGSSKINGRVLMPGETLSGYECMHPFDKSNGYKEAIAYENGKSVESIGGGVCQISTTLYNAALRAEMNIIQRQNHSMIVTYVDPSADAAIAGTYKDLKFSNPYDTPVYVEGYTQGRNLTFTIYGKETRPSNRTIKFVSETLQTMDPGEPVIKVDASLKPGTKIKEQSSHTGYKSRLWKYVYVDGQLQDKTILHTDTYNPSKAIYRVGPDAPAPTETTAPQTPPEEKPTEQQPEEKPAESQKEDGQPQSPADLPEKTPGGAGSSGDSVIIIPDNDGAGPQGPASPASPA